MLLTSRFGRLAMLTGSVAAPGVLAPPVTAQTPAPVPPLTQGPVDLASALNRIGRHFGVSVRFDRAEIAGSRGRQVREAATAYDAVEQATDGTGLSYEEGADGSIRIFRRANSGEDIVVIARRDEAETNLNVNSAATSTRTGKSLREQPRATTVVTARLIQDQQVQTVQEALRNVSGTTATGSTQGIAAFTVRGFTANALINGLSGSPGGAQPVAGLERIEVLKGPDVVLAGAENLGGIVNIVTKRPSATPLLDVSMEYGSFDDKKITVDASNALNESRTISARIVGSAAAADRSYQGYDGRGEYLFTPSLRYKTADSDVLVGLSTSRIFSPIPSITAIDQNSTDRQVIRPFRRSPLGPRRQGIGVDVTRAYFDVSQRVADWLTLVARGEHASTTQDLGLYLPAFPVSPDVFLHFPNAQRSRTKTDAVDAYARLTFPTGPVRHTVTAGVNYSRQNERVLSPSQSAPVYLFNLATGAATDADTGDAVTDFPAIPIGTVEDFSIPTRQRGFYVQDFLELGRVKLLAAVRFNRYENGITFASPDMAAFDSLDTYTSTLPSFGAVYDVTGAFSVYANYQRGYQPGGANFFTDSTVPGAFTGRLFPDANTTNIEGGAKLDLFNRRLSVVAAFYRNRQSNLVDTTTIPGSAFLAPGQEGQGFELDVTGRILPGWNLVASFSQTRFRYLEELPDFVAVVGQPRTKYSIFTSYEPTTGRLRGTGASIGIYGASRADIYGGRIDPANDLAAFDGATYRPYVPVSRQVDANLYYTRGVARLTLGVKNLFDRVNYNTTRTSDFLPLAEPRTYRATLSFRFY